MTTETTSLVGVKTPCTAQDLPQDLEEQIMDIVSLAIPSGVLTMNVGPNHCLIFDATGAVHYTLCTICEDVPHEGECPPDPAAMNP